MFRPFFLSVSGSLSTGNGDFSPLPDVPPCRTCSRLFFRIRSVVLPYISGGFLRLLLDVPDKMSLPVLSGKLPSAFSFRFHGSVSASPPSAPAPDRIGS